MTIKEIIDARNKNSKITDLSVNIGLDSFKKDYTITEASAYVN